MRKKLNLQLFAAPVISQFEAYRSDASGNATDDGTRVTIIYEYSCDSDSATMELKYKNVNDSDYNNTIMSEAGASGNGMITPATTFPTEEGYDFQISVSDGSYISNRTVTLSTAVFPFSIYKTGRGVAFGKNADTDELMDVQYAARFQSNIEVDREDLSAGNAGIFVDLINKGERSDSYIRMTSYSGARIAVGVGLSGENKGLYDWDSGQWIVTADNDNDLRLCYPNGTFKPYFTAGDSISSQLIHTAGFISTSGAGVYFTIPLDRPILGSPSIRITGTLIVRQDNSYLYGSSDSSGVAPSSWSANSNYLGLRVAATMGNTTNVTNNAPCGIQAMVTITFS